MANYLYKNMRVKTNMTLITGSKPAMRVKITLFSRKVFNF